MFNGGDAGVNHYGVPVSIAEIKMMSWVNDSD
jgi:hypothetical protein